MNDSPPSQRPVPLIQHLIPRIQSLIRRETRDRQRAFFIEGIRHFIQAADAGYHFEAIVYSHILCPSDLAEMLARRLRARAVPLLRVTPEQFRFVSTGPRASGIGAILKQRWTPLTNANPRQGLCWMVVEEIRNPGNLGTILRTAAACGVAGIIFVGPKTDPYDPNILRASMGGLFHLKLVRTSHEQLAGWALAHKVQLVGLSPEAAHPWTCLPEKNALALVIGEERQGLSPHLRALCSTMVRLPMTGPADSLNVSVAAGIALYELVRRSLG